MIAQTISILGLLVGAGLGLAGLLNPRWAANLVRLRDTPENPGGFAEFRGTYGGLFFGAHGIALILSGPLAWDAAAAGDPTKLWAGFGAAAVCAAMWIGTGLGRVLSIAADGTNTKFNQASVIFEIALGLIILAPVLAS